MRFSAVAGEQISVTTSGWSYHYFCNVSATLLNPDGSTFKSYQDMGGNCNGGGPTFIEETLSQTGTYTLYLYPNDGDTGGVSLTFYEVPAPAAYQVTPSSSGAAVNVATSTPGQYAQVTFGGQPEQLTVDSSSWSYSGFCPASVTLLNPDGSTFGSWSNWGSNCNGGGPSSLSANLAQTGTYTLEIWPSGNYPGSVTLTFYDPPLRSGHGRGHGHRSRHHGHATTPMPSPAAASGPARTRAHKTRGVSSHHRSRPRHRSLLSLGPLVRFSTRLAPSWTPSRANLRGDWMTGRPASPWALLQPLSGVSEVTALAGQTLALNGTPLEGVRVSIQGTTASAITDRTGRFLLVRLPAGQRVLDVDGATVRGRSRYASFQIGVDLHKRHTNTLGYPVWLPQLDPADMVAVSSPARKAITLSTPEIPGLEVRIPAGSIITSAGGKPVKALSVIPVPVDRPPFPLPMGSYFPVYLSVQPAGAYVSRGAEIIYPNYSHIPAGQRVPFWNYDPDGRGWYIYGQGTVSKNGKQIIPDPGVRVWQFSGAMISGSLIPPWLRDFFEGLIGADPVNLGSGLWTYQKTDLELPDALPIALTRVYRPADSNIYSFGIGMSDSYDMRLFSQNNYNTAELILPDGMDIHYVMTGNTQQGCGGLFYQAQSTPTEFYDSTITCVGSLLSGSWDLRLRNGLQYFFAQDQAFGLSAIRDRFGNQVTITRDSSGNLVQVTSPHGRWISFQHNDSNCGVCVTAASDNSGRTVYYDYNGQSDPAHCSNTASTGPANTLRCVKDANGGETYYTWDTSQASYGWMTKVTDARGNAFITNTYDQNGRVLEQTEGNETIPYTFSYQLNSSGLVTQSTMTNPNGNKTVTNLDGDGFPSSVTVGYGTSDAETTSYARQSGTDFLTSETDQLGRETTFAYDSLGNLSQITEDANGSAPRTTTIVYNPIYSQPESVTSDGHTTHYGYDSTGELTSITDPDGNTTTIAYANGDGQPTQITDPDGNTTSYGYLFGDRDSVTDPDGNTSTSYLDAGGRMVQSTDADGNTTTYGYDSLNDLTSVTDPDGNTTMYAYDADGDLTSITDANNHQTTFGYDNEDRLHTRTDALGNAWTYNYDGDNNLTSVSDPKGQTITYTPDALDRLSAATFTNAVGLTQSTIAYTYDLGNRLTQAQDSTGGTFNEQYDQFDELTQESGPNGTISYTYNPDGTRHTSTVSGQPTVTYGYDADGHPMSISTSGQSVGLSYDNDGRLQQTTLPDGITENYTYDPASQLTDILYDNSAGAQIGDLHYAYDPDGNRTQQWGSFARLTIPAAWGTALYNADNEISSVGNTPYVYDKDGNLTSDTTRIYSYNVRNQLTTLTSGSGIGASVTTFTYDPFGRRESQTTGLTTTNYLYDGDNVAQQLNGSTPTANYLLGPGINQRYSRTDTSGTQSYLTDALGSTLALANSSQTLPTTYTYDPFGAVTAAGASSPNPYQYAGQPTDSTGLQYNLNRYYNPASATFTSQDPLGNIGSGTDLYQYANDNPTDNTDPTGLSAGVLSLVAQPLSGAKDLVAGFVSKLANFVADHYGQIAEGLAGAACIAGLDPLACLVATGGAFATSTVQNLASGHFSLAGELLDALGGVPGVQTASIDLLGVLGEGGGRAAMNILSAVVGGSAIVGIPVIESAAQSP